MTLQTWPAVKDPDEVKDFGIYWAQQLTPPETITSSTWVIITGAGLVINSNSFSASATLVWLSGGTDGVIYELRNRIVTNSSPARTLDMTVRLICSSK